MAFPIGAVAGAAGGSGPERDQSGTYSGGSGRGLQGIVTGILHMRDTKKKEAAARAAAEQAGIAGQFDYARSRDRDDLAEDIALANYGEMASDYVSPELLSGGGADRFGGAAETLLMQSQGYNPSMSFNPFLGQYQHSTDSVNALADHARAYAEQGVSRWEDAMDAIGDEYAAGRDQLRADIDAREIEVRQLIDADRARRREQEATLMLEQWLEKSSNEDKSGKKKSRWGKAIGALGGAALLGGGGLLEAAAGGAVAGWGAGKLFGKWGASGSTEKEVRTDLVERMRSSGKSDAEIVEELASDPDSGFDHDMMAHWR